MSTRLSALAERRQALVTGSDQDRAELAAIFGGLERKLAVAEVVVATARRLNRHRVLVGTAGACLIFAPVAARSWIRRAMWLAPLAIEGYRTMRARADARRASPLVDKD